MRKLKRSAIYRNLKLLMILVIFLIFGLASVADTNEVDFDTLFSDD